MYGEELRNEVRKAVAEAATRGITIHQILLKILKTASPSTPSEPTNHAERRLYSRIYDYMARLEEAKIIGFEWEKATRWRKRYFLLSDITIIQFNNDERHGAGIHLQHDGGAQESNKDANQQSSQAGT